jgi:opacity protein-like surface antigen
MRTLWPVVIVVLLSPFFVGTANADVTAFLGSTTRPSNRQVRGIAVGAGFLIVGAEFEYADAREEPLDGAPALRTGMANVYAQPLLGLAGVQPYATTGVGLYREQLGTRRETNVGFNAGGGIKVSLLGPVRVRLDYRVFKLRGTPINPLVHRFYVGLTLGF